MPTKPLRRFFFRHRRIFWALHSVWALATGIVVLILAQERYGFVPWVILFLGLTWISTLYFSRRVRAAGVTSIPHGGPPPFRQELTSYLTRVMYQETLFFLLPFYWYSTVVRSANVVFAIVLAVLAVLSCLDLVFDRWLRSVPLFGLFFFATVAFAAINLVLPMLLPVPPVLATRAAIFLALGSAIPLAFRQTSTSLRETLIVGVAAAAMLGLVIVVPQLVPPVPLRVKDAIFSSSIDTSSLVTGDTLGPEVRLSELDGRIFVVARVFAPSSVPAFASLEWRKDGEVVRQSRLVEITAHRGGFRLWDQLGSSRMPVEPGEYEVLLRTGERRVFGRAEIRVSAG